MVKEKQVISFILSERKEPVNNARKDRTKIQTFCKLEVTKKHFLTGRAARACGRKIFPDMDMGFPATFRRSP